MAGRHRFHLRLEDRPHLEHLRRGAKDAEVRVRAQALWLLDQGRSQEETAAILGLNVTTLWRWRRRYVAQRPGSRQTTRESPQVDTPATRATEGGIDATAGCLWLQCQRLESPAGSGLGPAPSWDTHGGREHAPVAAPLGLPAQKTACVGTERGQPGREGQVHHPGAGAEKREAIIFSWTRLFASCGPRLHGSGCLGGRKPNWR